MSFVADPCLFLPYPSDFRFGFIIPDSRLENKKTIFCPLNYIQLLLPDPGSGVWQYGINLRTVKSRNLDRGPQCL
jgi:hypothetical protein